MPSAILVRGVAVLPHRNASPINYNNNAIDRRGEILMAEKISPRTNY